jgi:integrase
MTGKTTRNTAATFGGWLKEWHKLYDNKSENEKNIAQNEKYINNIIDNLGQIPLNKLSGIDIQAFLNTYNTRKNTRDKIAQKIKSALTMALNLGKIKANPYVSVSIKKHQSTSRRPLTFEEQKIIYENIDKKYFDLFNFCCCTGLRVSEALSVRKKDIDYERGLIYVKRLKKKKEVIAPVPFLPELLNFKFKDKLFNLTYNAFKCYLQDFYKKTNIRGVMIHNFRSTFASNCYAAGIKDKQIQQWLCHETLAMTMDTYTHLIKNGTSPLYEYIIRLKNHLKI